MWLNLRRATEQQSVLERLKFCKLGLIACGLVYCEYPISFHTAGKMVCNQTVCILCHMPK